MTMSPAVMAFFEESDSHLEIAESALLNLENNPDDLDLINELFRVTHSIKGNAGLVGLTDIHAVATEMESILDVLRTNKASVETAQQEKLFELLDKTKSLVDIARGGDGNVSQSTEFATEKIEPATPDDDDFSFDAPASPPPVEKEKPVVDEKPVKPATTKKEPAPKTAVQKGEKKEPKEKPRDASYLTFYLGEEQYGIDINAVREIILRRAITKVPNASPFLTGVMNLRGMVIPVIHAKKRLNFAGAKESKMDGENIIVVETEGVQSGIMVDLVDDIAKFKPDMIVSSGSALGGIKCAFISKLGKVEDKTVMLVDIVAFCNIKERFY